LSLILVRHSISQPRAGASAHDWQLTDEGREKVTVLSNRMGGLNIRKIVSSDQPKALETARLLAYGLGDVPEQTDANLRETHRKTAPFYTDLTDFKRAVQAAMQHPNQLLFGEETFAAAQARFSQAAATLISESIDGSVAMVSHGTILALHIASLTGFDAFSVWNLLDMPAYAVFDLPSLKLREICFSLR
jgi:broad specificity phosphatase PhoE